MPCYLSIRNMEICEFVSTQRCGYLSKLYSFTQSKEIEMET